MFWASRVLTSLCAVLPRARLSLAFILSYSRPPVPLISPSPAPSPHPHAWFLLLSGVFHAIVVDLLRLNALLTGSERGALSLTF